MAVKEFVTKFDIAKPDWSVLPEGFPNCDLGELTSQEIGRFHAIKALWQLAQPKKPEQGSRVWSDPEGYRYLVQWSNAILLRFLIRLLTDGLPKSEYRRKAQVDDAGRSVVRNIEEGYKRATTKEYIDFIGYSQGSLEEVKGDVREMTEDGFLRSVEGSSLAGIGINLGEFNRALKEGKGGQGMIRKEDSGGFRNVSQGDKGKYRMVKDDKTEVRHDDGGVDGKGTQRTAKESSEREWGANETDNKLQRTPLQKDFTYRPLTVLYPPLSRIRAEDLTYEIFLELINKTDWLLRGLVESLEKKLGEEQKGYQVIQAKIQDKFRNS